MTEFVEIGLGIGLEALGLNLTPDLSETERSLPISSPLLLGLRALFALSIADIPLLSSFEVTLDSPLRLEFLEELSVASNDDEGLSVETSKSEASVIRVPSSSVTRRAAWAKVASRDPAKIFLVSLLLFLKFIFNFFFRFLNLFGFFSIIHALNNCVSNCTFSMSTRMHKSICQRKSNKTKILRLF